MKAIDPTNPNYSFKLGIDSQFKRDLPAEAKNAIDSQYKSLNNSLLYDCLAQEQLIDLFSMDCSLPENQNNYKEVMFVQAFNPNVILGSSVKIDKINR